MEKAQVVSAKKWELSPVGVGVYVRRRAYEWVFCFAFARTFGFGLLAYKIWAAKSATGKPTYPTYLPYLLSSLNHDDDNDDEHALASSGVSFKTLSLYGLVFFFRLTSIIPFSGYLPYDK